MLSISGQLLGLCHIPSLSQCELIYGMLYVDFFNILGIFDCEIKLSISLSLFSLLSLFLFNNSVKEDVLNYHFHPTEKFKETDVGIIVEFTASGDTEICWNLFKWEDKVKILEPQELIDFYICNLKILIVYCII